ncbi:HEPACAM family member 2-like [Scyliorhinus canicula]|uniref:HEPACAM family member 2-like n=1 Tax=Scyliorhinus canicula TaxID=7830 RepID=UPI0018F67488|nr:HEPACAM family member 2-like [Scyliorhinus canicula]
MLHSWLQMMMVQLFLLAGAVQGVQVRFKDQQLHGIVGRTLQLGSEYIMGDPEDVFSVTWKVQTSKSFRIIQYSMIRHKLHLSPAYQGRVIFHKENGSMDLLNITVQDSGVYIVTVIDVEGTEQSASIKVQVYEPVSRPLIVQFTNGLNVTFICLAQKGTERRFHWLKDGELPVETNVSVVSADGRNLSLLSQSRASCGVYTCLVTNKVSQESVNKTISEANGFTYCKEEDNHKRMHMIIIMIVVLISLLLAAGIYLSARRKLMSQGSVSDDQRARGQDISQHLSIKFKQIKEFPQPGTL